MNTVKKENNNKATYPKIKQTFFVLRTQYCELCTAITLEHTTQVITDKIKISSRNSETSV